MTATAVRAVSEEDVSGGAQNGANYGGPVFVLRLVKDPGHCMAARTLPPGSFTTSCCQLSWT